MRSSRRQPRILQGSIATVLAVVLSASLGFASENLQTEHFLIAYTTSGPDAVSASYVRLVEQGLEDSYSKLTNAGFEIFDQRIHVDILDSGGGELGVEYLDSDNAGGWLPRIEIASQAAMVAAVGSSYTEPTLEDLVRSTCAHELFHVIQDYYSVTGRGDISEAAWVEAHATAIQEAVVPSANDYLEPALEFLLAPDGVAFLQRTYDAGIFWVYVLDTYGIDMLREVMTASAIYDGRFALDHAFAVHGVSFFEAWFAFALSLATEQVPDAALLVSLVPEAEGSGWWTANRDPAQLPALTFRETWTGETLTIASVNTGNTSEYLPYLADDPIGSALRIAHAYGIDYLEIDIPDGTGFALEFDGDATSEFLVGIASRRQGVWSAEQMPIDAVAHVPEGADKIRLVVTRSEPGAGTYQFIVRPE